MKYFVYALVAALLLVMIAACSHEPPIDQSTATALNPVQEVSVPYNEVEHIGHRREGIAMHDNWQGMHMVVAANSVTPIGLSLSMINDSELNFGYGFEFRIEQYLDGQWEQVPFIDDVAWVQPLFDLAPSSTVDENISWEFMHGELKPGQYRVVRNFIEYDWRDTTPMWERDIPEAYLYAAFVVEENWQTAHDQWQNQQDELASIAFARYEGLVVEILQYSSRGITFTINNNNLNYSYFINSVFVGWDDNVPGVGSASAVEYPIFPSWFSDEDSSWPFGENKRLQPGEYLSLEVDWYDQIGNLSPSMSRLSPNPYVFEIVVDVTLDVDEQYIRENFHHTIPELPNYTHRIRASFDISP